MPAPWKSLWSQQIPDGGEAKFQESVPERLPEPEVVVGGQLSKRKREIAEAMARAGRDLEGILSYLGVERRVFDTNVLEQLTRDIGRWMEDTRFPVNRATIASALTSKQMSDKQQAAKIFETTDPLQDKWGRVTANAADNIIALIKRAKRIDRLKRNGQY